MRQKCIFCTHVNDYEKKDFCKHLRQWARDHYPHDCIDRNCEFYRFAACFGIPDQIKKCWDVKNYKIKVKKKMPRNKEERNYISENFKKELDKKGGSKLIEIKKAYGYFIVEGKYYEAIFKDGKEYWKKIDKKEIKELEDMNKKIVKKISEKLDREAVVAEALRKMEKPELEHLHRMLFIDDKKYTVKTREHHCIDMKIGNYILPIRMR